MNLERRLQHAARELRGVEVAVPPLGVPHVITRPRARRLQMLAVPVLFVVGGLMAVNSVRQTVEPAPFDSDIVLPASPIDTSDTTPAPTDEPAEQPKASIAAPTARAELEMIAAVIGNPRGGADDVTRQVVEPLAAPVPTASDVPSRPVVTFGPI